MRWTTLHALPLLWLLLGSGDALSREMRQPLPAGKGLVVITPWVGPKLIDMILHHPPAGIPAAQVARVTSSDRRLLEPLRRSLARRSGWSNVTSVEDPCAAMPPFRKLVGEARDALAFLRQQRAERRLAQGWEAFACMTEPASSADLAEFMFLNGVLSLYQGRGDQGFFAEALAMQPDIAEPTDYSRLIQESFLQARATLTARARVKIRKDGLTLGTIELWIDGRHMVQDEVNLTAGRHFLQLVEPGGGVLGGSVMPLQPMGEAAITVPPASLRPPSDENLSLQLARAVNNGRLEPALAGALGALLQQGKHPWLVLVGGGEGMREARAVWVLPEGTANLQTVRCALPPFCDSRSPVGKALAGGLAVGATAALGTYAYAYFAANSSEAAQGRTEAEADTLFLMQEIGVGSAIGSGLGAIMVASFNWRFPSRVYRGTENEAPLEGEAPRQSIRFSAGAGEVAVRLELAW